MIKSILHLIIIIIGMVAFSSCTPTPEPVATDEDPFLWLEEVESEASLNWVKSKNQISDERLKANPLFAQLEQSYLEAFNDKDKIAYPSIVGNYAYNLWKDETNERGLWRRMPLADYKAGKQEWETVLDIDALAAAENRKWVFAGADWLSPDNKLCLLSLSDGGTDENIIREFNAETKTFVEGGFTFPSSKGGVTWIDENTLFVGRNFGAGSLTNSGYPRQLKLHKRGESLEDAKLVFETDTTSVAAYGFSYTDNESKKVFVYNLIAFYNVELYMLDGEETKRIEIPKDAEIAGLHKNQMVLSLQSDWAVGENTFTKGSVVSFDLDPFMAGDRNINKMYEPDATSSFSSLSECKDFVVVNIMDNVQSKLVKFTWEDGEWVSSALDAPALGSIYIRSTSKESNEYFFIYSNLITPSTLYVADDKGMAVVKKLKDNFNADNLVAEQFSATSKDGTQIPYFVVHKADMELNGTNPTMIYAYGGFNVAEQPDYDSRVGIGWLEQGGVYVLANIRGGGEFGPSWHQAAKKENRQNAYDDFYAVTEDVIAKKISSPENLGAFGWSNGGLLAGVVYTQRPDLYSAVVVGAPLLDMKRYSKLLAGASWMGEYGNPDVPEEWEYIKKYSPYHNLSADKKYPEVFFVTSTKDDRVHPGHARKMAALMESMEHPYLYHETIEGGHGAASTNAQQAYNWAAIYTYFNMKLNGKG